MTWRDETGRLERDGGSPRRPRAPRCPYHTPAAARPAIAARQLPVFARLCFSVIVVRLTLHSHFLSFTKQQKQVYCARACEKTAFTDAIV